MTGAMPLRSASSRVLGASHTRHASGSRLREGSARRVGGKGRLGGWEEGVGGMAGGARAKRQSSHNPVARVHTEETRPRHTPDPSWSYGG